MNDASASSTDSQLPDTGWVAVVKRDCPTCELTEPVLAALAQATSLTVYTQDDPTFPETVPHEYDSTLDISHGLKIEVVPTLLKRENGKEVARTYGWDKAEWRKLTGLATLGADLPRSARARTRSRRCSTAAGPTACPLCRRPRRASSACCLAPPATRRR